MESPESKKTSSSMRVVAITAIVLVAVIVAAAILYNSLASTAPADQTVQAQESAEGESSDEGSAGSDTTPAPDFQMNTPDGVELSLSSLKGKPVVLNFWASTCGPCRGEMPEFQTAFEKYGEQVEFAMVNVPDFNGETEKGALALIKDSGYTFPVYFPVGDEASIQYGLTSIPRTYFITSDGNVEAYAAGAIDEDSLADGIDMILE